MLRTQIRTHMAISKRLVVEMTWHCDRCGDDDDDEKVRKQEKGGGPGMPSRPCVCARYFFVIQGSSDLAADSRASLKIAVPC